MNHLGPRNSEAAFRRKVVAEVQRLGETLQAGKVRASRLDRGHGLMIMAEYPDIRLILVNPAQGGLA